MISLRNLSPVALGAMIAVSLPTRVPAARGFTYDIVQRTKSMNPMNGGATDIVSLRAHVQVDAAGHMRMDVVEAAANPMFSSGAYILASGSTLLFVDPQKKETLDPGPDMGMAAMTEFTRSMGMDMKVTDGAFAFDSLPGTELVNGRPTKHFHMTRDATAQMTTPMGAMEIPMRSETDYYVSRENAPLNNPLVGPNLNMSPMSMMSPQTLAQIRTVVASMKGFIVQTVTHSSTTVMGMSQEATSSTVIENIKQVEVAPISVSAPDGYTKASITDRLGAMRQRPPG